MKKLFVLAIFLVMTLALMAPACAASAVSEDQRYTVTEHYIINGDKPGNPDDDMLSMVPFVGQALEILDTLNAAPVPVSDPGPNPGPDMLSDPGPNPDAFPAPESTSTASPIAWLKADSSLLSADGEVVTDIAIGETYTLETTIRIRLSGDKKADLDASNLCVRMNGYMIMYGYADSVWPGIEVPIFTVFDRESETRSASAMLMATKVEANRAIVTYVKGSAELLTSDGTVIHLSDEEFLSQDGALIGNRSNDGALPAEATCTVRIKLETSEYRLLTTVNDLDGNPIESTRGEIGTAKDPTGNSMSAMPTLTNPWGDTVTSRSSLDEQQKLQEQLQQLQVELDRLEMIQALISVASVANSVGLAAFFINSIMLNRGIRNISKRIDDMKDDGLEDDESEDE